MIKDRNLNFEERFANIKRQVDELTQWFASKGLVQTEQKAILQAGSRQEPTPQEQMNTMISFMNDDNAGGHTPPCIATLSDQPLSNLKQAGIRKQPSNVDVLNDMLTFFLLSVMQ